MEALQEKQWKANSCNNLFDFQRGSENNMTSLQLDGNIPLVSAKAGNNGVKAFVKCPNRLVQGDCITLNNDGDGGAGLAYYQPFNMALDSHVTALKPKKNMRKEHMLFISECLSGLHGFFGHGLSISNARAKQIQIMLPTDEKDEPDYEFMEHYVSEKWGGLIMRYKAFLKNQLAELEHMDVPALSEKEWKPCKVEDIFENIVPGKISNASQYEKTEFDGIEYIAATNRNNGVLYFLEEDARIEEKVQEGNCIGFIKDGDGSAGYAIYKKENFASTVNVLYGYADWINEYTGLFFVACQDKIKNKYSHGYKRNREHLQADRIMLPTTNEGKPDWDYMEQYAKNLMLKKYQQYLEFLGGQGL